MQRKIASDYVRKIMKMALLAAVASEVLPTIGYANLMTNGSFETPVIPPATFFNIGIGAEPAGFSWTVTNNNVDIVSNGFLGGTAFDGVQWFDLVGFGSTGGVQQAFATTPGQQYTLFFAYANNPGAGVPRPVSADVMVTSGANTLLSQSISHASSVVSNLNWTPFNMTFTATGTSAVLAFDETVGGANGGVFLDAVSVDVTAPPVPEPATIFLLGTGLAALGLVRRRR